MPYHTNKLHKPTIMEIVCSLLTQARGELNLASCSLYVEDSPSQAVAHRAKAVERATTAYRLSLGLQEEAVTDWCWECAGVAASEALSTYP